MNADHLRSIARDRPEEVVVAAAELLQHPTPDSLPILHEAMGWARYELGELTAARSHAEDGLDAAVQVDQASLVGLGHLLGTVCIEQGQAGDAERSIARLVETCDGDERVLMRSVLAMVLGETGRYQESMLQFEEAFQQIQSDNIKLRVRLLNNRAVIRLEAGDLVLARSDLAEVEELAFNLDDDLMLSIARHNLGVAAARSGSFPRAIELFAESAELCRVSNMVAIQGRSLLDVGRLWLDAGLLKEGRSAASEAIDLFRRAGVSLRLVESYELAARLEGAAGNWQAACETAEAAVRCAETAGLGTHVLHRSQGLLVGLRLAAQVETSADGSTMSAPETHLELLDQFPETAVDAGLLLARGGHRSAARSCLRAAASSNELASGLQRVHQAVGAAGLAELDGDRRGALSHAWRGLELVVDNGVSLGVTELRTAALRRTGQLRQIAVRCLMAGARDVEALTELIDFLELERATRLVPEPELSDQERVLVGQMRHAVAAEQRAMSMDSRATLTRERIRLEAELADLRRQHQARSSVARRPVSNVDVIVHQFRHQSEVGFIVDSGHREPAVLTFDQSAVTNASRALEVVLATSATHHMQAEASRCAKHARELLAPLLDCFESGERVLVVPDPTLPPLPWSLLSDAAFASAPSASDTMSDQSHATGAVVAVAGPGLRFAESEARAVAGQSADHCLVGSQATTDRVISALSQASTLHLAAHGQFRSDNPLCSSVELFDGPLSFFDLLGEFVPDRVFFSACNVGTAGGSPTTLASLLLQRGCRAVVASSGPVNDEASSELMGLVHDGLATGATVAHALTHAQKTLQDDSPSVALYQTFGLG